VAAGTDLPVTGNTGGVKPPAATGEFYADSTVEWPSSPFFITNAAEFVTRSGRSNMLNEVNNVF
jgi:hypothetical protein